MLKPNLTLDMGADINEKHRKLAQEIYKKFFSYINTTHRHIDIKDTELSIDILIDLVRCCVVPDRQGYLHNRIHNLLSARLGNRYSKIEDGKFLERIVEQDEVRPLIKDVSDLVKSNGDMTLSLLNS